MNWSIVAKALRASQAEMLKEADQAFAIRDLHRDLMQEARLYGHLANAIEQGLKSS